MEIKEIFKSIQGESSYAGLPCVFIRTAGCNLRCTYCDTRSAFNGGEELTIKEIENLVLDLGGGLVEITGGEPLLQEDVPLLSGKLIKHGCTVLVETNGSLDVRCLPEGVKKIVDIKCPGSGMASKNLWSNLEKLSGEDEIKFVICDRNDFVWSRDVIREHDLDERFKVLISCAYGSVDPGEAAKWILEEGLNVRLQMQLHKILWGERGERLHAVYRRM